MITLIEPTDPPDQMRFCGSVLRYEAQGFTARKWPIKTLNWHVDPAGETDLSPAQIRAAFRTALDHISSYYDLTFVEVSTPGQAHIAARFARIDSGGGTLAYSGVSDGTTKRKEQVYDTSERWVFEIGRPVGRVIDLFRVVLHEVLHALGVLHLDVIRTDPALMEPTYSLDVAELKPRDLAALDALGYGRRRPTPSVPPPPPPGTPPAPEGSRVIFDERAKTITVYAEDGWRVVQV